MAKYITDEMKKMIDTETAPVVWEVERGDIRRLADAVGDPNPLFNDEQQARKTRFGGMIALPTLPRLFGDPRYHFKLNLPKRALDGGSEWEYFIPIRPGDRITTVVRLANLRESEGRLGTMVFTVFEYRYTNQFNELCAVQRATLIAY